MNCRLTNQLLLDTQKFRRRAAAVKTRNRFCKQNLDICKISLFPQSKKLPINQLLLDTQKFRRRAAAVKTRNRFCKQNLDICKISLFPQSKKLPINQLLLDTQKFRSSLFYTSFAGESCSQFPKAEPLVGFKGKAFNILCSLRADKVRP